MKINRIVNIGSGCIYSIREISEIYETEYSDLKYNIEASNMRDSLPRKIDILMQLEITGFNDFMTIEDYVRK